MWRLLLLLTCLVLTESSAPAADLPPDVSGTIWFADHCANLSADRVARYPDVARHRITYAWQSENGYLWDWENGKNAAAAAASAHYCARVALYDRQGAVIENITMLCSVNDRGKPTEVWMFGNADIAKRLCPMGQQQLRSMDGR